MFEKNTEEQCKQFQYEKKFFNQLYLLFPNCFQEDSNVLLRPALCFPMFILFPRFPIKKNNIEKCDITQQKLSLFLSIVPKKWLAIEP